MSCRHCFFIMRYSHELRATFFLMLILIASLISIGGSEFDLCRLKTIETFIKVLDSDQIQSVLTWCTDKSGQWRETGSKLLLGLL